MTDGGGAGPDREGGTSTGGDPVSAEIAVQDGSAVLIETAGRWVLTMTRGLRHPPDRVWPLLTEPAQLARWSPVVPDRALISVGAATARETPDQPAVDAEVLVCDPPRELVHRWGPHLLRWSLALAPGGCRLTLEHTFDERGDVGIYAAGWHLCLAVLVTALEGHPVERVVGARADAYGWQGLRDRYDRALR
jgi:uncharacterized protein YndB with AHSA1/START domain